MNLLFDFLKNLHDTERAKLIDLRVRGVIEEVWEALNQQVKRGTFNKEKILADLDISASHFDKVTSELLTRCYKELYPEGGYTLLNFLCMRVAFLKHFYAELNRQMKTAEKNLPKEERTAFYKSCLTLIHINIPIAYRDEEVMKKVGDKYISQFTGPEKKQVQLLVECKLLLARIDTLFAAARIIEEQESIKKRIDKLGPLPANANEQLVFEYYWIKLYFQHAIEKFAASYEITQEAIKALKKFKSEEG